ncbi:MAG: CHC2 zinc finger domain-containing protein [Melioribacteraceae bacterium]|nr:CHC2 zinc finger domain-containing protein [Melioribacteraceae bacterium]
MTKNLQHHSNIGCNVNVVKSNPKYDIYAFKKIITESMNIEDFCNSLDIKIFHNDGKQIRSCCPIHHGKRRDAFSILYKSKDETPIFHWMCRTDCQDNGDIIDFIMKIKSCSFEESCNFLSEMYGVNLEDLEKEIVAPEIIETRKDLINFHNEVLSINKMHNNIEFTPGEYINEEFVQRCIDRRNDYFLKRGFLNETLELFEVGFCPAYDSPWKKSLFRPERVTIPLRDENFKLVGISGRVLKEHESVPKYKIVKGSNKKDILYGLYFSKPYIIEKREAIVVEGFADFWRCWESGIRNVVAICGKDILEFHIYKLLSMCHSIVNALDEDVNGIIGRDKLNLLLKDIITVKQIKFGGVKDIGEMPIFEVRKMFKNNNIQI